MPTVINQIVATLNSWDSVDGKTNGLEECDGEIEQQERDNTNINQRRRQDDQEGGGPHVPPHRNFVQTVFRSYFWREARSVLINSLGIHLRFLMQGDGPMLWHFGCINGREA